MTDPTSEILTTAEKLFTTACRARDTSGELVGEILWLWSRPGTWTALKLPTPVRPELRVEAVRRLAKSMDASTILHIAEVTIRSRHLNEDGTAGDFLDEDGKRDALLGMLCTPDGDVVYMSFIVDGRCSDVQARGDLVGTPLSPIGTFRGLMRPVPVDTTQN
jgi:hypothetical protein